MAARHPVQFKGSAMARWLLRLAGWRVTFDGLPALQGVVVAYPHTSNWDFIVGILAKWAIGIPAHFWAKDSLFKVPVFGPWLRWVGGLPIDRSAARGAVGQTVDTFHEHAQAGRMLWLAAAPEGTRKWTPGWRSGFYQVALGAGVPVGIVRLDWGQREIRFVDFLTMSGDEVDDYARLATAFEGVRGYHPEQGSPIVPWRPSKDKK
ncbi:1-acyl-sn-glycerol-3-phosphate acyltransferase [Limnohabitans sp.]|uniref:1-acyl-sn-glycerol-3-phosphate acyltransferase n=1 Tax=Limnohabitans sp. TaxID=1907725 RepID=UPI0035AE6395